MYGLPYELSAPVLGVLSLSYALTCLLTSQNTQTRLTVVLTFLLGVLMLLVVVGGSVFVVQDIARGGAIGPKFHD